MSGLSSPGASPSGASPAGPPQGAAAAPLYRRALVAFGDDSGLIWLRFLKPGFRHCFVALDDGARWLTVDPLAHRVEIRAPALPDGFDLAAFYRRRGLTVIEIAPAPVLRRGAPLALFTCVEIVKRLIGVRAAGIVTPWQLYRHLRDAMSERGGGADRAGGQDRAGGARQENAIRNST